VKYRHKYTFAAVSAPTLSNTGIHITLLPFKLLLSVKYRHFTESGNLNGRNFICIYLRESGSLSGSKVIYMPVFDRVGA
jgi:hypothetical protein